MAIFLAFGNMKGGVGKSTCTVLAANALSQAPYNYRVTVVDVDRQKSITHLRELDADPGVILPYEVKSDEWNVKRLFDEQKALDRENDLVLVDMPGKLDNDREGKEQEIGKALGAIHFLFIPFTGGNFSLDASLHFLRYLTERYNPKREAKNISPLQIVAFSNMHRQRTRNSRYLLSELEQVKAIADIPVMRSKLNDYTLFRDTDTVTSLYDTSGMDPARHNFTKWIKELHEILTNE
jgi:cellulose biosynthesis protein BcsQ